MPSTTRSLRAVLDDADAGRRTHLHARRRRSAERCRARRRPGPPLSRSPARGPAARRPRTCPPARCAPACWPPRGGSGPAATSPTRRCAPSTTRCSSTSSAASARSRSPGGRRRRLPAGRGERRPAGGRAGARRPSRPPPTGLATALVERFAAARPASGRARARRPWCCPPTSRAWRVGTSLGATVARSADHAGPGADGWCSPGRCRAEPAGSGRERDRLALAERGARRRGADERQRGLGDAGSAGAAGRSPAEPRSGGGQRTQRAVGGTGADATRVRG